MVALLKVALPDPGDYLRIHMLILTLLILAALTIEATIIPVNYRKATKTVIMV